LVLTVSHFFVEFQSTAISLSLSFVIVPRRSALFVGVVKNCEKAGVLLGAKRGGGERAVSREVEGQEPGQECVPHVEATTSG
jgi:hypothetical protein